MSAEAPVAGQVRVTITVTPADLKSFAQLASRQGRRGLLILGTLQLVAGAVAAAVAGPTRLPAGVLPAMLGGYFFVLAADLPRRTAKRLPATATQPRTCEIDGNGIRLRGATWYNDYAWADFRSARLTKHLLLLRREPGAQGLALPRSAFSEQQETAVRAILVSRNLLADVSR